MLLSRIFFFFFFNDTATTEIYTLSLHDALPICMEPDADDPHPGWVERLARVHAFAAQLPGDRKSTRLNSSHVRISYAVFCLKKKKHSKLSQSSCAITSRPSSYARDPTGWQTHHR